MFCLLKPNLFLDDYTTLVLRTSEQPCSICTRKSVFSGFPWLGLTTLGSAPEAHWQVLESSIVPGKKATQGSRGKGQKAQTNQLLSKWPFLKEHLTQSLCLHLPGLQWGHTGA